MSLNEIRKYFSKKHRKNENRKTVDNEKDLDKLNAEWRPEFL